MRALLILILITGTASADTNHEAMFGSHIRSLRSSSANALTDESLTGAVFGYGYRLPIDVMRKLELWATGMVAGSGVEGEMFQTLSTHMWNAQFTGGVRARYDLWRGFVVANARLDLGAQRLSMSLEDKMGHEAHDTAWGALSTAALGLELNPLVRRSFGLGLRAEFGYVFAQAIGMTARSDGAPEDTIELDRMAASIGHLDASGRYFSFTILGRF